MPICGPGICCVITSLPLVLLKHTGTALLHSLTAACWLHVGYYYAEQQHELHLKCTISPFSLSLSPPLALSVHLLIFFRFYVSFTLTRRSSSIRPGQFGYGRVPFSLPLHRPNRQARHTANGTDAATPPPGENDAESNRKEEEKTGSDTEEREAGRSEDEEITEAPAAEESPTTTTTTGNPPHHRHFDRPNIDHARARVPPPHTFSRSSSPSHLPNRHRFDWHSVTAPPPPVPPLSRSNSPAATSPFSTSLHRPSPVHRDRELHPGFSPQVPQTGNVYPLQHPHIPHMGVESGRAGGRGDPQVYRCPGPEKEYRRCFSQVRFPETAEIFLFINHLHALLIISVTHIHTSCFTQPAVMLDLYSCRVLRGAVRRGAEGQQGVFDR